MLKQYRITPKLHWFFFGLIGTLLLSLMPNDAHAGVFYVDPLDKSMKYLGMIFGGKVGNVVLGGTANPVLSGMFERFNIVVLTLGLLILSYVAVAGTFNTAHQGQVMGKKWANIWLPLRASLGMLLMIPTPGSGYSMIQSFVMWVVLQGIGAANEVWSIVLDYMGQGFSITKNELDPNSQKAVNDHIRGSVIGSMYELAVCEEALRAIKGNKSIPHSDLINNYTISSYLDRTRATPNGLTYEGATLVGVKNGPGTLKNICGQINIKATGTEDNSPSGAQATNAEKQQTAQNHYKTYTEASTAIYLSVKNSTRRIIQTQPDIDFESANFNTIKTNVARLAGPQLNAAAENFLGAMVELGVKKSSGRSKKRDRNEAEAKKAAVLKAKADGWIFAGAFYYMLTKIQEPLTLPGYAMSEQPTVDTPQWEDVARYLNEEEQEIFNRYKDAFVGQDALVDAITKNLSEQDLEFSSSGFLQRHFGGGSKIAKTVMTILVTGFFSPFIIGFKELERAFLKAHMNNFTGKNGKDPLVAMKEFGDNLMFSAEMIWLASIAASVVAMGLLGAGSCASSIPYAAQMAILLLMFVLLGALMMLWGVGALLAIYLPLIPFMMFSVAALGWMIAVIEAVIGGPIIALGLISPSGEELGRAAAGFLILANVFLRPVLMIFGFIIASRLIHAIIRLANDGFIIVLPNHTGTGMLVFFAFMVKLVLYSGFIIAVVNKCFGLIVIIPNKILVWMGASPEQGYGEEQIIGETKQSYQTGAQASQEVIKGGAEAGKGGIQAGLKKQREEGGGK